VANGSARLNRSMIRIRGRGTVAKTTSPIDAPPAAPPAVPRGVVVLLGMAGTVVTVAGMRAVADILGPVLLALMLTVTVSPMTAWLRRLGTPAWLAAMATATAVYLLLLGLFGALVGSVVRLMDLLPTYQSQFAALRADLTEGLHTVGIDGTAIHDVIGQASPDTAVSLVQAVFSGVLGAASDSILLLAIVLFMCLDAARFPDRLMVAATERPEVVGALRSFAGGTRQYLLVSTVFGLIVAVIDTIVLWAMGIPLPLLWGLLAFITNYIPNIGFVIGLVPPALLALLEGGADRMLAVIVFYSVVNFVIQSVIQPKVVGDAVGLSPTVSFMSLVFWGWVLGPLGALLAIPLSLLTKGLLVDVDPATHWINPLISAGGAKEPPPTRRELGPAGST
jgi:predicted PurR-regulated permease PerM